MTTSPTITAAGRHYSYSAAFVAPADWPNPCSLLTLSSAQAALQTTASSQRFHNTCTYQPQSAMYPTLSITLLAVGTASGGSYSDALADDRGRGVTPISGVGLNAFLHPLQGLPAVRLDVLTRYAHFSVTEQSPAGLTISLSQARTLLVGVGRVAAQPLGS